jgi:Fe-S oxidoreductase/nitrate reductase gamma subunit
MSTTVAEQKLHPVSKRISAPVRRLAPGLKEFAGNVLLQRRVWRKGYAGVMHALIFWGVTIQVVGTAINLMQMQLFVPFVELPFPRNGAYLVDELVMDLAGVGILLGVLMAAFRRAVLRPATLETTWEDVYALVLLALIPLVGFTLEGLRLLAAAPPWAGWSPVGNLLAQGFRLLGLTPQAAEQLHPVLFWTHVTLGLALLVSIPFTKFRHLLQTPLHILLRSRRKAGVLEKIENIEETDLLGVGKLTEFTPVQILSFDACVRCGRCEENCPQVLCGGNMTPKSFIQALRQAKVNLLESSPGNGSAHAGEEPEILGDVFPPELPWSCTTCGYCLSNCPAFINPVDEIIDLRRYQTLVTGKIPKPVADTLRNIERQGNPWGLDAGERAAWMQDLEVRQLSPGDQTDVLLFVGCALAFDERNKKVARSLVRLLQKAQVDFGVLGLDEVCCGETARRLGHEYLFQMLAEQNLEAFSQVKFRRIVTQCPHCYNTLKNEYPQFGADFVVQHYTEFLAEQSLTFAQSQTGETFTYHDSCYLGRYNQVLQPPRQLLGQARLNLVEMRRNRANSLCCGGGGGQMWQESESEVRINHRRLQDALDIGAARIATACPYCLLMFDDAIRSKGVGDQVQVMDISEILDSLAAENSRAAVLE